MINAYNKSVYNKLFLSILDTYHSFTKWFYFENDERFMYSETVFENLIPHLRKL